MSDHILQTLADAEKVVEKHASDLRSSQKFVNQLCKMANHPPRYSEEDITGDQSNAATGVIRGDEYYGKPLSTVVQLILEARKAAGQGPASIADLYDAMEEGGYHFEAKSRENSMRGLRISISKNSAKFHKLPTGKIGLLAWYPAVKESRPEKNGKKSEDEVAAELSDDFMESADEDAEMATATPAKPK